MTPAGGLVLAFEGQGSRTSPADTPPRDRRRGRGHRARRTNRWRSTCCRHRPRSRRSSSTRSVPPGRSSRRSAHRGGWSDRAWASCRRWSSPARCSSIRRPADRPVARRLARRARRRPGMDHGDAHSPPDCTGVRLRGRARRLGDLPERPERRRGRGRRLVARRASSPRSAPTRRPRGSCRCRTRTTPR